MEVVETAEAHVAAPSPVNDDMTFVYRLSFINFNIKVMLKSFNYRKVEMNLLFGGSYKYT